MSPTVAVSPSRLLKPAAWLCRLEAMKRTSTNRLLLILALGALAGCDTSLSTFYKPGVAVTSLERDQTQCEVQALRDAPVANEARQDPPTFYPGRRICNSNGQCYREPGYWIPGRFYTVDVNAGLRNRVLTQCMADKGYQPVTIPACAPAVKQAVAPKQTSTLPTLAPNTCVIKYDGGAWQLVTPVTE